MLFFYFITLLFFCALDAQEVPRAGFFTEGTALYWQAEEGGLAYAVESASAARLVPKASVKNFKFDWDFGFKLGLGYRIPHDRWELLLRYTSLQTHSDKEHHASEGRVFFPTWQTRAVISPPFADAVRAHWRLHLGLLDLLLGKSERVSTSVRFTPQIGIRTGWIRQKFNIEYRGGNLFPDREELVRMKNKYWGIGPELATEGEWSIGAGWSAVGSCAFSLLFGQFYLHQDEDTLGGKEKILGIHGLFHASGPIAEMGIGFRWQRAFSGTLKRLALDAGWDQLFFFSQNRLMLFMNRQASGTFASNQGDLSIAGIHLTARFDF